MAKRVKVSTLNASTIDIINVIRANASAEYQSLVPKVASAKDIPRVGEVLYGYPAMANQFISSLINRIALVRIKSAMFNNPYARLKKGYLEFGETVEETFVQIAKAREFSAEKAEARELKRSLPDVRTAFHIMNWRVQYPVTIQDMDLYQAFKSIDGVQDLIAKITQALYVANDYDEFLLFKYLLIKAVSKGQMYPVYVGDGTDLSTAAVQFRSMSNLLTMMSTKYNASGVHTVTPRADQVIFMDSEYNAKFDVQVLAGAFNMDKADFMGRLYLIDNWTEFDNERFEEIRAASDMIEEVTAEELELMKGVKAIALDAEWFQVYDNQLKFTEKYVASGEYWNYFLNSWKTISSSPFSNAIVFCEGAAAPEMPDSITVHVDGKDVAENATVLTLSVDMEDPALIGGNVNFVQTEEATTAGVAIHKYGAVIFPPASTASLKLVASVNGQLYQAATPVTTATAIGDTLTMAPMAAAALAMDEGEPVAVSAKARTTTKKA